VVVARGQEAQRLEKELEDTGMKLTSVLTDVTGAKLPAHPRCPHRW
jgi:transposase